MASLEPLSFRWVEIPHPDKPGKTKRAKEPLPGSDWRVRYRKPGGEQTSKTFRGSRAKTEATKFAGSVETDKDRGDYVDPRDRRRLFDDWADDWWKTTKKLSPNTRRTYWFLLKNHVRPYFAGRPLLAIDWLDVENFITHLATKQKADGTPLLGGKKMVDCVSIVSLIMKTAVRSNIRKDNPADDHKIPRRTKKVKRQDMFDMAQLERFVAAAPDWYAPALWTLIFTGYRPSEFCGARIRNLDFVRCRIETDETRQPVGRYGDETHGEVAYSMVTGPTKSEAGDRSIPLPRWLVEAIAEQLAIRAAKKGVEQLDGDEYLFVSQHHRPLNRDTFRQGVVRPALVAAGLPEKFRTYDFRHTHASLLIDLGANVLKVSKRMGHAQPSVTMNVYGHLFKDEQEELTEGLDGLRSAPGAPPAPDVVADVVEMRRPG